MVNALYIEISTVGILLLVIILITQRQTMRASAVQRQFNRLVYATMIMHLIDAGCWLIDGQTFPFAHALNVAIESLYYVFFPLIPFFWALFVETALSTDLKAARRRLSIAAVPLLILIAFVPFNVRLGWAFSVDEANVYHRMPGFLVYTGVSYGFLIYASIRALIKARGASWVEDRKRCYMMAFFIIPPSIGGIIQVFYYGISLNWILASIAILLVYIDSQNRQISTDPLTGLNNRRELSKFLLRETREVQRDGVLALLMMDVDGFKLVNDTYGHFYGDSVLLAVAKTLKDSCKNTEAFLGRYGGDEFCVVYPASDIDAVTKLTDTIRNNLKKWNAEHPGDSSISLSIGCAIYDTERDECADSLVGRADRNMYEEKNAKRQAQR